MNRDAVDRLFASALDLPRPDREGLLQQEPDAALRAEVRRLLSRHALLETDPIAAGFLAGLDLELAARLVDTDTADPVTIGRFTVLRRLGTGGTGVVYLAHDPDLDRDVAIKLLGEELGADAAAARRFADEARAASGLDHPHVVTVFETGRTDKDRLFIVMAYHDGETLRQRILRGALPPGEALRIATEVTDGMTSAHARGVVHCDIKPENILLTSRGAKLVDFGIARAAGNLSPHRGSGTAAYMSPEQARGAPVDHRTDLWSLGVVLHEMLTGERPFVAERRDQMLEQIRQGTAPALPVDVPAAISAIVNRCLSKEPADRPQSMRELHDALRAAVAASSTRPRPLRTSVRRMTAVAALLLAVTVIAGRQVWSGRTHRPVGSDVAAPGVAVLPYRAVGPDVAYLSEGMVDLLSFGVEGVVGLRKINPSTVLTAWRSYRGNSLAELDEAAGLEIARRVQARYLITGSVVQSGSSVRLVAEVRDVEAGQLRGLAQVTGPIDSVPGLVDRLTLELLRLDLLPSEGPESPVNLSVITTASLPALKEYLGGEREFRVGHWREAGLHYQRALGHDSTFARALYRFIKANDWGARLGDTGPYLLRLAPLVARLPERDRMLITGDMGSRLWPDQDDGLKQIEVLETMMRRYPDDVEGWVALGDRYFHDHGRLLLPPTRYRAAFVQAMRLNPNFHEPYLHLIEDAFVRLDSAEAQRLITAVASTGRSSRWCTHQLLHDLTWGSRTVRQRALHAVDTIPPLPFWLECLPTTAALPGPPEVTERLRSIMRHLADSALSGPPRQGTFYVLRTQVLAPYGKIAELRRALADLEGKTDDNGCWAERWQVVLHLTGHPDSTSAHRAASALARSDHPIARFWVGLLAMEEARWTDAEAETRWLEDRAGALATEGDQARSHAAASYSAGLRAYRDVVQRGVAALPGFESTLRRMPLYSPDDPASVLRYLTGMRLFARGELEHSRRYFESFGPLDHLSRLAAYHLGRIAARQGHRAEAAGHFRRFVAWWQDADPDLQPLVAEARLGMGMPPSSD